VVGVSVEKSGAVSVRNRRHGDQGAKPLDQFLAELKGLIDAKTPVE